MRVTTKGRYALRALTKLAMHAEERPIPIKRLAEEEEISPEFLEQIFFRLKKSGVIRSVRGPGGGFMMNREPADVSVREIFDAVGEGIDLTPCSNYSDDGNGHCVREDFCIVHDVWQEASVHINQYFDSLTLDKVIARGMDRYLAAMERQREAVAT
ncbi:MAG: Rrf2 family transcriptional regulator [Spirochaetaceae bacterium]|nr:MAG: Rrf2 family transcriptional regulator [Spirochaetaceae bacterium]